MGNNIINSDLTFDGCDPTIHDQIEISVCKSTDTMLISQLRKTISLTAHQAAQLHYILSRELGYSRSDHEGMSYYEH